MTLLYPDKPWSQGAENVLKRAKQLMDLSWTPIKPLPCCHKYIKPDRTVYFANGYFIKWKPQTGAPYSSVRKVEKYIGWNVSPETFLSALENPNSVVYTRTLPEDPPKHVHCYYGLVCSMYVCYALQLPYRIACNGIAQYPGMDLVDSSKLENLRLCDVVLDWTHHVAIITGIERDCEGKVHRIEVSECVLPAAEKRWYDPKQFTEYWLNDGYKIYRYDKVDQVEYIPDPFIPLPGDPVTEKPEIVKCLMLDYGNKANYRLNDEPVEMSIFEEGWDSVEVTCPDGSKEYLPVEGEKLVYMPKTVGKYSACLYKDGNKSKSVQWCVVNINITFEKETCKVGEPVAIHFSNDAPDEKVFHLVFNNDKYFVKKSYFFTDEEIAAGTFVLPPIAEAGKYIIIVLSKNEYGYYTSRYTELTVEA